MNRRLILSIVVLSALFCATASAEDFDNYCVYYTVDGVEVCLDPADAETLFNAQDHDRMTKFWSDLNRDCRDIDGQRFCADDGAPQ